MRMSFDILCRLWSVVAVLELTGTGLTCALPTVVFIDSVRGNLIVAENSCGLSLKVRALEPIVG